MNFGGTVISVKTNTQIKKKQGGGTYNGYQLVFRNEAGEIKTIEKAMQSLTYTPSVADTLNNLKEDETFNGTMEKEDGFWNVKTLSKGDFVGDAAPTESAKKETYTPRSPAVGGKVVGSTYETPEERKLKQRLIVRQSSLNQAMIYFASGDISDALELAEKLEAWVYRGLE